MKQTWASSERLAQAQRHYECCFLCEHRCGVDRHAAHRGPCKARATPRVFRQRVEYGDEAELVPSHLFYLSGCDLRCVFCINELNAFDPRRGQALTEEFLHRRKRRRNREETDMKYVYKKIGKCVGKILRS
jgi:uncharacterized Fe-S radical SAM superfamily protein PflX